MLTIRRGAIVFFSLVAVIFMVNLPTGVDISRSPDSKMPDKRSEERRRTDATTLFSGGKPEHDPNSTVHSKRCPLHHTADHGLVNTGRRALVFYTFTSQENKQDRQVELDNYLFFQAHGVLTPDTPTALFSAVDYIVLRSDLKRPATAPAASRSGLNEGVNECGSPFKNVRFVETPSGPCDLCSVGRTIKALGGAEVVAREYEFILSVNSGARGPFFSETPGSGNGTSPVTWIDHLALGGEKVYTGAVMYSSGGVGMGMGRPFLHAFAFGMPSSALVTMQPVLFAGCMDKSVKALWSSILQTWGIDFHKPVSREEVVQHVHALNASTTPPARMHANDTESVRAAKKEVEATVAKGLDRQKTTLKSVLENLEKGAGPDQWGDNHKMRCVVTSEFQLLKTMLDTPLPPSATPGSNDRRLIRRPHLTAAQEAQLSPTLSGYLHEGHFFARSWHHIETMVTIGHAHIVLTRPQAGLYMMDPCSVMFLKFGGTGWRGREIPDVIVTRVQELSLVQSPPLHTSNAFSRASFVRALQCSSPQELRPLT